MVMSGIVPYLPPINEYVNSPNLTNKKQISFSTFIANYIVLKKGFRDYFLGSFDILLVRLPF